VAAFPAFGFRSPSFFQPLLSPLAISELPHSHSSLHPNQPSSSPALGDQLSFGPLSKASQSRPSLNFCPLVSSSSSSDSPPAISQFSNQPASSSVPFPISNACFPFGFLNSDVEETCRHCSTVPEGLLFSSWTL